MVTMHLTNSRYNRISISCGECPQVVLGESDPICGDEQVVEAALAIRGQEWVLDPGGNRGLRPQLPVRYGLGGQIDDVDRDEIVRRQRFEIVAPGVNVADVVFVDPT